jgi:hypothetical protein
MAEMTEAERQAQFQHDIDIINRQADSKIAKMKSDFATLERRHVAQVEKTNKAIKAKFDVRIKAILAKGTEETQKLDLQSEQEQNAVIEADMRECDRYEQLMNLDIEKVELWRRTESADEVRQLQTHTQRPRKD